MGWEPYQTVEPLEPQVCRGLFGVRLLILRFKIQFFKSIKSSTLHIFLNLTYPLRKKSHSQNVQNHPKIYTKPQNIGECSKWSDLALLET